MSEREIKDSGHRRVFETGAQRDREEGKGLPTLVSPIFIRYIAAWCGEPTPAQRAPTDALVHVYRYLETLDDAYLKMAARDLMYGLDCVAASMMGVDCHAYPPFPNAVRALARHLEKGAKKYSARNWELGMPCDEFMESLIRHLLSWINGEQDEPHPEAAAFNIMGFIHTREMVKRGVLPVGLAPTFKGYMEKETNNDN